MSNDLRFDTIDETEFDTVLSPDIDFTGLLVFDKPFLIKGKVTGEIQAKGELVIAEGAHVAANISAPTVKVHGSVKGNIVSSIAVEVSATGSVIGDITAPEILMETGCVFNGSCTMTRNV